MEGIKRLPKDKKKNLKRNIPSSSEKASALFLYSIMEKLVFV